MELFNRLDRSRQDQSAQTSSTSTIHQNTIKEISSYKQDNNLISKMSTCGLDGAVVVWDLNVCSENILNHFFKNLLISFRFFRLLALNLVIYESNKSNNWKSLNFLFSSFIYFTKFKKLFNLVALDA